MIQPPVIEVVIGTACEQQCVGICGAAQTAMQNRLVLPPDIFRSRVLDPLIADNLKPPMVTLTGGSVGLPVHRKTLESYLGLLKEHDIPTKLSTTLYFENDSFWQFLQKGGFNIPRIHTSFRDPDADTSERQGRLTDTGDRVITNLNMIQHYFPDTVIEIETLLSRTLSPHLSGIGKILTDTMSSKNKWEWQLQTLKASGSAGSLQEALLGKELVDALSFLQDPQFLFRFGPKNIKLLCMPPVCDPAGQKIKQIIDDSDGKVYTTRCTEGQVSTQPGIASGVVYIAPGKDESGKPGVTMRPCFIVALPNENLLPNLMKEDVVESYLNSDFFKKWRNPDLVPEKCNDCKVPHGSFEVQRVHHCVPNCRASACSIQTTGSLTEDLKAFPPVVELQFRDKLLMQKTRLELFLWGIAGSHQDQPADADQWAGSFAYELQQMNPIRLTEKEIQRLGEIKAMAVNSYGWDNGGDKNNLRAKNHKT